MCATTVALCGEAVSAHAHHDIPGACLRLRKAPRRAAPLPCLYAARATEAEGHLARTQALHRHVGGVLAADSLPELLS